jgi:molybdopterin molybdotransferase
MRGFHQRIPLAEALQRITGALTAAEGDEVAVADAHGRILLEDACAVRPVPAFDRSAMDGFAVFAERTFPATSYDPVSLDIVGQSLPGAPHDGDVEPDQAVRIMTGAPVPAGADAVVPAEFAEEGAHGKRVFIQGPVAPGKNVSRVGEDLEQGAVGVARGRRLRPQDLGVLASIGLDRVLVASRPRVRVVATGDEIVRPGTELDPFHVFDADTPMLGALIERWGGDGSDPLFLPDDEARLRRTLGTLARDGGVDVVLVTGGTSVGTEDHAPQVLAGLGELLVHGVALRPASPLGFGVVEGKPVFLLPGNPVACLCAFDVAVGPALRALQGLDPDPPYNRVTLPLVQRLASVAGRTDYARVQATDDGVLPIAVSGASVLTTATRADGFVVVPADVEGWDAGDPVEVHLYA